MASRMTAAIAVGVLIGASACGPKSDSPKLPNPSPAATGAPVPATPVTNPPSLAGFHANPCALLNPQDLAMLSIVPDPVGPVQTLPSRYGPGCNWFKGSSAAVSVTDTNPGETISPTLADLLEHHRQDPQRYTTWIETSIDGLPLVLSWSGRPKGKGCAATVGVADDNAIDIEYELRSEKPVPHWQNDPCGAAAKAAELVIKNLR